MVFFVALLILSIENLAIAIQRALAWEIGK